MRKLHWLFMAVCLAVMPVLQSCDDDDGIHWVISRLLCGLRYVLRGMLFIWTVMCGGSFGR